VTIYELYGRKEEQLANLQQEYFNLLSLVHRIKIGEVRAESVQVNLDARSWTIIPPASPEPSTNGNRLTEVLKND